MRKPIVDLILETGGGVNVELRTLDFLLIDHWQVLLEVLNYSCRWSGESSLGDCSGPDDYNLVDFRDTWVQLKLLGFTYMPRVKGQVVFFLLRAFLYVCV